MEFVTTVCKSFWPITSAFFYTHVFTTTIFLQIFKPNAQEAVQKTKNVFYKCALLSFVRKGQKYTLMYLYNVQYIHSLLIFFTQSYFVPCGMSFFLSSCLIWSFFALFNLYESDPYFSLQISFSEITRLITCT
jgi:hypothetical protein